MSKYWDIHKILPYNRCFNFINAERSVGKTYTAQKFILGRWFKRGDEFIYIVRTQDEKKKGILGSAFEKVLANEFADKTVECTTEDMFLTFKDDADNTVKEQMGYCIALSEALKIKKRSFPRVKYILFDEYMLEDTQSKSYVNGWNEPDLFLSIYHTVDREQDRVICFFLGNNTSFYNPYHLHDAFRIPNVVKGAIWCSENVLFQWATASEMLKEDKAKSKFLRMIENSKYGQYASKGDYIYDNTEFIGTPDSNALHIFSFIIDGNTYGVWSSKADDFVYITSKYDPSCRVVFVRNLADHNDKTTLTKDKKNPMLVWLGRNFKTGNLRFENMEVKKRSEEFIVSIL